MPGNGASLGYIAGLLNLLMGNSRFGLKIVCLVLLLMGNSRFWLKIVFFLILLLLALERL